MNQGGCSFNAYLEAKELGKEKSKYAFLKTNLIAASAKGKSKADDIYKICQKLCYYHLETELIPTLLQLLANYEDKKLLRIIYYFLSDLAVAHNDRNRFQAQIVEQIKSDMAKGPVRQIMCLRSFSGYLFSEGGRPYTLEVTRKIITDEEIASSKKEKQDPGLTLWLKSTVAFELHSRLASHLTSKEVGFAVIGMCSGLESFARSAIVIATQIARTSSAKELAPHLRLVIESNRINLTSSRAWAAFMTLCGVLAAHDDIFLVQMIQQLPNKDTLISFAAIENLISRDWTAFDLPLTPAIQNCKTVVELVVHFLVQALGNSQSPIQHAACRLCRLLAEKYVTFVHDRDSKENPITLKMKELLPKEPHPLLRIHQKLDQIIPTAKGCISIQAFRALIWLGGDELFTRLTNIQIAPELFGGILDELLVRVQTTPEIATTALQVVHSLFITNPSRINDGSLILLWKTVLTLGSAGRIKVIQHIFKFLASGGSAKDSNQVAHLHAVACWALGEFAHEVSIDEKHKAPRRSIKKANTVSNTVSARSPEKSVDNDGDNNDKPDRVTHSLSSGTPIRLEKTVPSLTVNKVTHRVSSRKTPRSPQKKEIPVSDFKVAMSTPPGVFPNASKFPSESLPVSPLIYSFPPLSNPMTKLIIMKLETALFTAPQQIKIVALHGLAKIAFLSGFEVKLHLYSFFHALAGGLLGSVIASDAGPVFMLLYRIMEACEAQLATPPQDTPDDVKKKLINEISKYCTSLPPHYDPCRIHYS